MPEQEFFGDDLADLVRKREAEALKAAEQARLETEQRIAAKTAEELQAAADLRIERGLRIDAEKKLTGVEKAHAEFVNRIIAMPIEGTDKISETLKKLTELSDFRLINQSFNSIPTLVQKMEYVGRIVYERLECGEIFLGPASSTLFYKRLAEIGMPLLCRYLRLDGANKTTHEDCLIDKEPIWALCQGRYDICKVFNDRMTLVGQGLLVLPPGDAPEIPRDPNQECLVDLEDLNDWWRQEGKYE